jgi:O-antigen ligase
VGEALPVLGRIAPALVAALGSIVLGIADGGFFARAWAPTIVAFAAAVELALLVSTRVELSRLELTVLALLGAFAGWSALSAAWSADPPASLREAERGLLYLVALLAMLLAARRGLSTALTYGVLAATTFVSLYGLVEYLAARPGVDPVEGTLLFEPLGYANAAGILAAIGAVISCWLALRAVSVSAALARAAPLAVLIPTLALTESRGSWAALVVALVILVSLRLRIPPTYVIAVLAALAVAGGALIWLSGSGAYGDRPSYWRVAWHEYRDNPVLGSGAGTYVLASNAVAPSEPHVLDAHNLYLESLAELGPVGLALITAGLCLPMLALRRSSAATPAGLAYLAFLIHAGIDWDWEMPAVTLAALGCAAALLVAQRGETTVVAVSGHWRTVTALFAVAVALAVLAGRAFL